MPFVTNAFRTLNTEECISFTARESRLLYRSNGNIVYTDDTVIVPFSLAMPMPDCLALGSRLLCLPQLNTHVKLGLLLCITKIKVIDSFFLLLLLLRSPAHWLFCSRYVYVNGIAGVSCLLVGFVYGRCVDGQMPVHCNIHFFCLCAALVFSFWFFIFRGRLCCCVGRCLHTMNTRLLIRNNKNYE